MKMNEALYQVQQRMTSVLNGDAPEATAPSPAVKWADSLIALASTPGEQQLAASEMVLRILEAQ